MTQVELFNKFKESHHDIDIPINTFVKLKPWYVRPITIHDMCCCHYHVEFELYYDTFLDFGKTFWKIHLLLPQFMLSYPKFYVKEKVMSYFTTNNVLVERNAIIVEIWLYSILSTLLI
jgi:hypothetical protein